jgi:poly(A) polymerase
MLDSKKSIDKILKDETLFSKLCPYTQNSLNGLRATQNLMKQVPNVKYFRNTLRAVKLWAMRRGVYSHPFGYLGGVSYAIMVAKVCQDYPGLEMADLLLKFFEVYSDWKWMDAVSIRFSNQGHSRKFKKKEKLNLSNLQMLNSVSYDPMIILTPI